MLDQLPEFLSPSSDGEILLRGHRIGLEHIVWRYNEGDSPEMLVCRYPTLPLALVHRVIAYYLDHRGDVDAYAIRCRSELDQQAASGQQLDLATLRERLHDLQQPAATGS